MIRMIFHRSVQDGPESWAMQHKSIDVRLPEVEALMDPEHDRWSFVGVEVMVEPSEKETGR